MFKICKTGQIRQLTVDTAMMAFFKKSALVFLLLTSQFHFLRASPSPFPGRNVNSKATWPISQMSSTATTDYYSSYNYYNHPFYRFPFAPWPMSSSGVASNGPSSRPGHQLTVPVLHHQIPNIVSHSSGIDAMISIFLTEHNKARNSYGAPELVWNPDLVPAAARVTDTCTFKHTSNNQYGENLAAGQTSPQEVVSQWVNGPEEKSAYDPKDPRDSHFTQVVWHGSREIGCAVTSCTTLTGASLPQSPIQFWACEYNPPGNVETLYLKNVHAAAGGAPL